MKKTILWVLLTVSSFLYCSLGVKYFPKVGSASKIINLDRLDPEMRTQLKRVCHEGQLSNDPGRLLTDTMINKIIEIMSSKSQGSSANDVHVGVKNICMLMEERGVIPEGTVWNWNEKCIEAFEVSINGCVVPDSISVASGIRYSDVLKTKTDNDSTDNDYDDAELLS